MAGNTSSGRAAGPAPLPKTPHHLRRGADIDDTIRSLEAKWHLGLKTRDNTWSPSTKPNNVADKICGLIKRLYFSAKTALDQALASFEELAPSYPEKQRLELLLRILSDKTKKEHGDPVSRTGTPRNEPPKSLMSSLIASRSSQNASSFHEQDDPDSYTTAVDLGSPTDEDSDNEFTTPQSPPSPTPASRMTPRVQASPFNSLRRNTRKRSPENLNTASPPKLTKTSKGKQPRDHTSPIATPSLFKKPSLPLDAARRALQARTTSTVSSVNTSFNTSISSSQETNNSSANTSFTSNDGTIDMDIGADKDNLASARRSNQNSSFGHDLLGRLAWSGVGIVKEQEQRDYGPGPFQGLNRASSSTFGSIDEESLLDASVQAESSKPSISDYRSMQTPSPIREVAYPRLQGLGSSSADTRPDNGRTLRTHPFESPSSPPTTNGTNGNTPPRTPYYIRNLPKLSLFFDDVPAELTIYPFFLLFICCRISIANGIPMRNLMHGMDLARICNDSDAFWSAIELHTRAPLRDSRLVWAAAKKSLEGFTLKGKLVFNTKLMTSDPVFRLELSPISAENTCRFQRKFGSDRILYLTVPSFTKDRPERFNKAQMRQIEDNFKLWLLKSHTFLGRQWRVFHIQPVKKKGDAKKNDNVDVRLVLFATDGLGISRTSLGQMLNWFIDFNKNRTQNFCKAFARLDLGLTTTTPTFTFKPSQIKHIGDVSANGIPEATDFNDPTLDWSEESRELPVMNDGCSQMSVGAAKRIWEVYKKVTGSDEPLPSAIQGRIAGAKGMWVISSEPQAREKKHEDVWIQITDSQLKFKPHWEDEDDARLYDTHRLTFDHVKHSRPPASTDLHISFIPILVDRGVPRDVIAKHIVERLDIEREELLGMLSDPVKLNNWITKQSSFGQDLTNTRWQAALPMSLPERIKLLLHSGFKPREAPYLAKLLSRFVRQRQISSEQKLRAPLGKATFLYGVADPLGVLKPGEVHIHFSTPFTDEFTGRTYRNLSGLELLVARQPALRRSDVQKVRSVSHPRLSHLVDVIVFPVQGEYPLAGKLQGGDYDGDIFWICWEDPLVQPFRNAPAPLNPPDPKEYGIIKDKRELHQVMNPDDLSTVDKFLKEAFEFRTSPSLLGQATNFHEKVVYFVNTIHTDKTTKLADVHDLLVDAPKQAYIFSTDAYNKLIRYQIRCGNPRTPAYKEAMEANANVRDTDAIEKHERRVFKHKPENVLDYLYFEKVHTHNVETYRKIQEILSKEEDDDAALRRPFFQLQSKSSQVLQHELNNLVASFAKLNQKWGSCFAGNGNTTFSMEVYDKACERCYVPFRALTPSVENTTHPEIAPLLYPYLGPNHPTLWETIRASALYTAYPQKHSFVWHMAGRELAQLKARGQPDTRDVVAPIFAYLKPKPIKAPKPEDEEEDEDEFEAALEQLAG